MGTAKKLPWGENGKNIHWDAKQRWTGMKSAKWFIYTLAKKLKISPYSEHSMAENLINTQHTNFWKEQVLQALPTDFSLHMLLFGGWGCQLKRSVGRWSFCFCARFGDEGRSCGKFLRPQEWPLSKLELGLMPTWPSPFSSASFCFPAQPQVSQNNPVTIATGLISSPSRLIWKNIIYNVLIIALIHWFNEP